MFFHKKKVIKKTIINSCKHHDKCLRTILHFKKYRLLVTISSDGRCICYEEKESKFSKIKDIEEHEVGNNITNMIKWTKDSFITSDSVDNLIRCFSARPPDFKLLKTFTVSARPNFILKVDNNHFVCLTFNGDLFLYTFTLDTIRSEECKKLKVKVNINYLKRMILSKIVEDSFFVTTDGQGSPVFLVDCKKEKFVTELKSHQQNIIGINTFTNPRNEEVVTIGGNSTVFYIYVVYYDYKKKIYDNLLIKQIKKYKNQLYSIFNMKSCYSFLCDYNGRMHIYDIRETYSQKEKRKREEKKKKKNKKKKIEEENYDFKEIASFQTNSAGIFCMEVIKMDFAKNEIIIAEGDNQGNLTSCKISGIYLPSELKELDLDDTYILKDLLERVDFVISGVDEYCFSEEDKKNYFLEIKLSNFSIDRFPKTLFL